MKLRNSFATVLAAAAGVMGMAAAPAMATAPATTHVATTVAKKTPQLTTTFSSTALGYGKWLKVTVHLGPTATNRTVSVHVLNWGTRQSFVAETGKVDKAGNFTFNWWDAQTRTWWASFSGDASDNAVTTKGVAVHVGSLTSGSFSHYYATKSWNGHSVKEFHASSVPLLQGTVTPNKSGQNISVDAQYYNGRSWVSNGAKSFALSSGSAFGIEFEPSWPKGFEYRTAVSYGGDLSNGGSSTGWEYWTVTN